MAATPVATDSAAELKDLVGDDSTATFESDPKFIDSDPTGDASSENVAVQRDTDDTEDSEEEEDEDDLVEEDEDEDSDEEDEEDDEELEDEDEEVEDDEDEVGAVSVGSVEALEMKDSGIGRGESTEPASDENLDDEHEGADEAGFEGDSRETDHAVDVALRMRSMMSLAAGFAANA